MRGVKYQKMATQNGNRVLMWFLRRRAGNLRRANESGKVTNQIL